MSKYKDMAMAKASNLKGGVKDLKGGVKGKVNGVLGRKQSTVIEESNHVAAPLSSLRDPNSFAPPPRRTDSGLAPPAPRDSTPRRVVAPPSSNQFSNPTYGDRRLLEAPPDEDHDEYGGDRPSLPYRTDTTGLSTSHLPPPPTRRDGANERSPPSYESTMSSRRIPPSQPSSSGPSLPPRLPPRSSSQSLDRISPIPSSSSINLNQGAVGRLGAAGVSVPGFGIGSARQAGDDAAPAPAKPPRPSASQPDALYNRFAKSATSSAENVATRPSEGTTWAQKEAAFKTVSAFQKDPSSVSFADAKAAASTANNFRERHGHQLAAGIQAANKMNDKYDITDKVGALSLQQAGNNQGSASYTAPAVAGLAAGKKKPPPPPPSRKKPSLVGGIVPGVPEKNSRGGYGDDDNDAPPPVPFATRPTF